MIDTSQIYFGKDMCSQGPSSFLKLKLFHAVCKSLYV